MSVSFDVVPRIFVVTVHISEIHFTFGGKFPIHSCFQIPSRFSRLDRALCLHKRPPLSFPASRQLRLLSLFRREYNGAKEASVEKRALHYSSLNRGQLPVVLYLGSVTT